MFNKPGEGRKSTLEVHRKGSGGARKVIRKESRKKADGGYIFNLTGRG